MAIIRKNQSENLEVQIRKKCPHRTHLYRDMEKDKTGKQGSGDTAGKGLCRVPCQRLKSVSPTEPSGTNWLLLSHLFIIASKEWGMGGMIKSEEFRDFSQSTREIIDPELNDFRMPVNESGFGNFRTGRRVCGDLRKGT